MTIPASLPPRVGAMRQPGFLVYALEKCPRCDAHHVAFTIGYTRADRKRGSMGLPALDKTEAAT